MDLDPKTWLTGTQMWLTKRALGPFWYRRRELAKTQWYDAECLHSYQVTRLRAIARHAYRTVPFYRRRFDEYGFRPDHIADLTDVQRLPLLTKTDILAAGRQLISTRHPRWLVHAAHTGGTTGTPLTVYRDWWSLGNEHAFVRRQWDWAGIGLGARCAYLTGRTVAPPDQVDGRLYRYDPIMKELVLSTYHLGPAVIRQFAEAMGEYSVSALVAYPSAALTLARGCRELGLQVPLRAVLTSSEVLSSGARRAISAAFECPVFDFYGSAERVCYIHCCELGSCHVIPEYGLTEFLPDESEPGLYRVVATGFWNSAMPLFRYNLGDLVELGATPCRCGRHFPTVARIVGRPSECIVTPSGRQLGSALLSHLLYGPLHLLESQLAQDAPDHVIYRYVRGPAFCAADIAGLRHLLAIHLPRELRVDLVEVGHIPRTASGKFRPIIGLAGLETSTSA